MPKPCPHCALTNPDAALVCDCGYEFSTGKLGSAPDPADNEPLTDGEKLLIVSGSANGVSPNFKRHSRKGREASRISFLTAIVALAFLLVIVGAAFLATR